MQSTWNNRIQSAGHAGMCKSILVTGQASAPQATSRDWTAFLTRDRPKVVFFTHSRNR